MSFPKQFIQDLQDRIVLSEVIGKRVKITRAGRDEFKACCPFHNEKTPSFTLNNQKGFYHCFGCGAHGDAIGFLQEHDNLSFRESVEQLAALAGLQVPQSTPEEREKFERQKTLYDLLEEATVFFENQLPRNREVMDYLAERGLVSMTIAHFRIGYAPSDGQALEHYLTGRGYAVKDMIAAGVLRQSDKNPGENYSFFRDRIMFPVTDLKGRVVAYGGRILPSKAEIAGSKAPKYINSSDTALFHKGQILYNLANARKKVAEDMPFIVVEGYMDVIALAQAGYDTAVAPMGTALTESQVEVLWRTAPADARVPVLCFDGDNAGRRAASRAMERILPLLKPDHSVKFAFLPDGEDPDSLVKSHGKAAFEKFLEASSYLSRILWEEELQKRPGTTPEDRAGLKSALTARAKTIVHTDVQNEYLRMMTARFHEHFSTGFKKTGRSFTPYNKPVDRLAPIAKNAEPVRPAAFGLEHYLLATLINYPELFDEVEESLGTLEILDAELQNLRQAVFESLQAQETLDSSELKDILEKAGYRGTLDAILSESLYLQAVFARPGQDLNSVKEGWYFTVDRSRKRRKRQTLVEKG